MTGMVYADIVEGCRHHDAAAQRALYDATAAMAFGVCMRYAANRDEAHDMMQDGYVKVYEHVGRMRDPERLMAWVYSVMVNTAVDSCRKKSHERLVDDLEPLSPPVDLQPYLMHDIVAAMQQLTPRERLVFNMAAIEGYTMNEIAKSIGSSNLAVRVMLSRARNKMRTLLTQ